MVIEKTQDGKRGLVGKVSLDLWAVATALVLALLVRLNVIPTVKW